MSNRYRAECGIILLLTVMALLLAGCTGKQTETETGIVEEYLLGAARATTTSLIPGQAALPKAV